MQVVWTHYGKQSGIWHVMKKRLEMTLHIFTGKLSRWCGISLLKKTQMPHNSFILCSSFWKSDSLFSVISLGENKVEKLIQNSRISLNSITHSRLIRTYPAGTRTDSSNYNPVPMWNSGCQIGKIYSITENNFSFSSWIDWLQCIIDP